MKVERHRQEGRRDREQARQVAGRAARYVDQREDQAASASRRVARTTRSTTRSCTRRSGGRVRTSRRTSAGRATRAPSRTRRAGRRWAGSTSASRPTRRTTDLAFEAAECIASPENQAVAAELGGLPPTTESVYDDPKVKKAYPFADRAARVDRRRRAAARDPGLQRHLAGDPEDVHPTRRRRPQRDRAELRDRIEKAARGRSSEWKPPRPHEHQPPAPPAKKGITERARAERKLAWLLCAPQ